MGQAALVACSNCSWSSFSLTYNVQPPTPQDSLAHTSATYSLLCLHQHHFRVLNTVMDSFLRQQECHLESQVECMWLKLVCTKVLTVLPWGLSECTTTDLGEHPGRASTIDTDCTLN